MALEQVSSVVKSTYLNNVAGYDIQYNVAQDEGQNVTSITGTVKKADVRFGLYYNQCRRNQKYFVRQTYIGRRQRSHLYRCIIRYKINF